MTREEAIEVYNGLINTKIKEAFEFFAPELAESEDERIRKELIQYLKDNPNLPKGNYCRNDFFSWLEKQGEQKLAWSKEDEKVSNNILYILNQLEDNAIYNEDKIAKECIDWIYSIKDRVQPQPKQEWSEEDEKKRTLLISILEVNHPNGYFKVNPANTLNMEAIHIEELVDWLKSLRPHNHWKPNEEQMRALANALSLAKICGEESAFDLRTLYEQLKKLREERL